jgi:DUF1009 family protein
MTQPGVMIKTARINRQQRLDRPVHDPNTTTTL